MAGYDKDTLRAAIYGVAIGDALGVPYEFEQRNTFACSGMTGGGTWKQHTGTWSDDTAMTLATLDSLNHHGGQIDAEDMLNRFRMWLLHGDYAVKREVFDVGNTTKAALLSGHGLDDEHSQGNGSLMRVLPLAFTPCGFYDVEEVSAITHAHWTPKRACAEYVGLAKALLDGEQLRPAILEHIRLVCNIPWKLSRNDIQSGGYVLDTLQAAVWCLVTTNTYRDAVLEAVNLGGDTDTTAAVTGGLAGIMYGYESIPSEWVGALRDRRKIDLLVDEADWIAQ